MASEPLTISAAGPLITKLAGALVRPIGEIATKTKEKVEVRFRRGFSRFIEENINRFSTVKTIISSSTPIPLISLYVNLLTKDAGNRSKVHRDEDFLQEISRYKNVLFTATAGSGKSMLMRYLYLKFLETQADRLPVFIELRELNQHPSVTLRDYIRLKIVSYIDGFSDQQIEYALDRGYIILFLDGFDEVDHDKRKERELQINDLAARYPNAWTFVSSRPAETFASWEKFFVFQVQPFSQKQVELLISKIPYDEEVKILFRKKMADGLYDTHREFLTNPLLSIMMLITLEQFAEIPAKVHLFYEYAFEALFGRHDVTKGGFQRKRHTTLALDDFKRLFAYFCAITYMKKLTSFSADRVLDIIQQSITSSQIKANKVSFLKDLTESTCMLVADGLDYTFSHRSFQEYFSAYFFARVKVTEFDRAFPRLVERALYDNVVRMLAEMNREKLEEAWALPSLQSMCDRVAGIDAKVNCVGYGAALLQTEPLLVFNRASGEMDLAFTDPSNLADTNVATRARFTLYNIYGIFSEIHRRLKLVGDEGLDIGRKIKEGKFLGDDPRFNEARKSKRDSGLVVIPAVEEDSSWANKLSFGRFLEIESELLPKLKNELQHRVEERRRGLAAIFEN